MMKARRRYHLHVPGLLYIAVTVMLGFGAVNSQNNLLFLAFGLALGSILVSGLVSGVGLLSVSVERTPISAGRVGEPFSIVYRVRNRNRWLGAFGLVIEEASPRGGRRSRRRRGGRCRHMEIMPQPRAAVIFAPAGRVRHVRAIVLPTQRGEALFNGMRLVTTFPFGVFKKSVTFEQRGATLIRPELVAVAPTVLEMAFASLGRSETVSRRLGRDAEFYGLREYASGDSLRQIAWRATARADELIVRESFATVSSDVMIGLSFADSTPGASDEPDDRDELAISVVATLAQAARQRGARVVVVVPACGLRIEHRPTIDAWSDTQRVQDSLAKLDLRRVDGLRRRRVIPLERGSALVVHAREVDPSVAPTGAGHVSAARAVSSDRRRSASSAEPDRVEVA